MLWPGKWKYKGLKSIKHYLYCSIPKPCSYSGTARIREGSSHSERCFQKKHVDVPGVCSLQEDVLWLHSAKSLDCPEPVQLEHPEEFHLFGHPDNE